MDQVRIARGWGDCYGHALVATGRAEIAIDPLMSPWDIAALIPILREAGGHCLDWQGQETIFGGDGVSVTPALKDQVISILSTGPGPARQITRRNTATPTLTQPAAKSDFIPTSRSAIPQSPA
jgi:hypothetical protein